MKKWNTDDLGSNETILCDTGMVDTWHLIESIECTTQRVNPNINHGL